MRLVDDHAAHTQLGEPVHESWPPKSLGREEKQAVVARDGFTEPLDLLGAFHRGVDERRGDAALGEAVDLVLHQRDEGRDHHRQAASYDGRDPVADALSRAGGRDREYVAAREHGLYDLCLTGSEFVEAEDLAQHAFSVGDHLRDSDRNGRAGPALLTLRCAKFLLLQPLLEPGYRLAGGMLQDHQAAEDAVQEAAFKAWRKLRQLRDGSEMRPWFLGIVANECRSVRRSRWSSVMKLVEPARADSVSADAVVSGIELRSALRALDEKKRLALVLHWYLDLPLEEVATITGSSVHAVEGQVQRGMHELRQRMKESHG